MQVSKNPRRTAGVCCNDGVIIVKKFIDSVCNMPVLVLLTFIVFVTWGGHVLLHRSDDHVLTVINQHLRTISQRSYTDALLVSKAVVAEHVHALTYLAGEPLEDPVDAVVNVRNYTGRFMAFDAVIVRAELDHENYKDVLADTFTVSGKFLLMTADGVLVDAYMGMLPGENFSAIMPVPWKLAVVHAAYVGRYVRCKGVLVDSSIVGMEKHLSFVGMAYQ